MLWRQQTVVISLMPQQCRLENRHFCQQINNLDIKNGELNAPQKIATTVAEGHFVKSKVTLAIDDDWLDYQHITFNSRKRRVQRYLIQRQRKAGYLYDVYWQTQQAHLWQLSPACYQSYRQFCQCLNAKLQRIMPLSQLYLQRLQHKSLSSFALVTTTPSPKLWIYKNNILLFSQYLQQQNLKSALHLCQQTYDLNIQHIYNEQGEEINNDN